MRDGGSLDIPNCSTHVGWLYLVSVVDKDMVRREIRGLLYATVVNLLWLRTAMERFRRRF